MTRPHRGSGSASSFARKRQTRKPFHAAKDKSLLKQWFHDHADYPYPSKEEKLEFTRLTNLSLHQVSVFFVNMRIRSGTSSKEGSNPNNSHNLLNPIALVPHSLILILFFLSLW